MEEEEKFIWNDERIQRIEKKFLDKLVDGAIHVEIIPEEDDGKEEQSKNKAKFNQLEIEK